MADSNDTPPTVTEEAESPITDDAKTAEFIEDKQETPKTDEEKADDIQDTVKTDEEKADDDETKETTNTDEEKSEKYENEEFESDNEPEGSKTDEEKSSEATEQPVEAKTDDEKLVDDTENIEKADEGSNNGDDQTDADIENTEMENQSEKPEVVETKEEEPDKPAEEERNETGDDQNEATEAADDTTVDDGETKYDTINGDGEQQTEDKPEDKPEDTTENTDEPETTEPTEEKEKEPVVAGAALDKEDLEAKIKENEDLALKLESALSNQQAERDAYRKLTEENAKLQKHHDDMKEKFDEMNGSHMVLVAEVETFRKVNQEQQDKIVRLEADIKLLKETEGGDENIRDMQAKLIRLSDEQEEKDKRIHSLEGELDAMKVKLQDAESRAAKSGNNNVQSSKTCIIM